VDAVVQCRHVVEQLRRTIWWQDDRTVAVIDQRRLPQAVVVARWRSVDDAVAGIADMAVRGAPLIGVAAAHGLALAVLDDPSDGSLHRAAARLIGTRPTAVNLRWAVERLGAELVVVSPPDRAALAVKLAQQLADDDAAACGRIGVHGAPMLAELHRRTGRPVQVLTHCNAGWLACIELGTATAPIYTAATSGVPVHVWVSETRPRNQGAALTAWELGDAGIPHTLVVDNAAGHLLASGLVDCVIVGADRVARNGDTANKIGTSLKAYAAAEFGVPFHVAIPWSTVDWDCTDGASIEIEERPQSEVLELAGVRLAPATTSARNWGFDVTAARFITSFITPDGVVAAHELELHRS
jgi:methylthioribose-1-phosphate isomerase